MTKHGHPLGLLKDDQSNLSQELREMDGFNIIQLFTLAKRHDLFYPPIKTNVKEPVAES